MTPNVYFTLRYCLGTGGSTTPKIKTLPPNTTSVSRDVLAQLVSYVRENPNFSADVRLLSPPFYSFLNPRHLEEETDD